MSRCVGCNHTIHPADVGWCPVCSAYERMTESSAIGYPHTVSARIALEMAVGADKTPEAKLNVKMPDGLKPYPCLVSITQEGLIHFDAGWGSLDLWPDEKVEVHRS